MGWIESNEWCMNVSLDETVVNKWVLFWFTFLHGVDVWKPNALKSLDFKFADLLWPPFDDVSLARLVFDDVLGTMKGNERYEHRVLC